MSNSTTGTREPDQGSTKVRGSDFARLSRRIQDAGLMERTPVYFAVRLSLIALAFVGVWAAFFLIGNSWWQIVTAVAMAAVFGQVGLVSHELAHRQIFSGRRLSEAVGRAVGNLGIGLGYGWWQDKHTRHHANPNHLEKDPDVRPGVVIFSSRHAKARAGFQRWLTRNQAWLFFPLTLLAGPMYRWRNFQADLKRGYEGVNLNTWLVEHGYMTLQGQQSTDKKLDDLFGGGTFWEHVDWSRTRAYAMGIGQIYLNLRGRESRGDPGSQAGA